jgi:hypothetical protein
MTQAVCWLPWNQPYSIFLNRFDENVIMDQYCGWKSIYAVLGTFHKEMKVKTIGSNLMMD